MEIKNKTELSTTPLRKAALKIAEAGLLAIDTKMAVEKNVRLEGDELLIQNEKISLSDKEKIFVIGIGKCALDAAKALEEILGDRIFDGIVLCPWEGTLERIKHFHGDHPIPTQRNVDATKKIIELLSTTKENDLVIFIISGGGSALLCQPENLTCQDEKMVFERLTKAGADIRKLNTVRKHLSLARGGYLAKHAYPAEVVSLIFSDVVGDDLTFVASGPTVRDSSTVEDARGVLKEYSAAEEYDIISKGLIETPKEDKYFERVKNILFVSNETALEAMKKTAGGLGFNPRICTSCLAGEARAVGKDIIDELRGSGLKTALLYGGETTVTIKGRGKGGRNMELVLSALQQIEGGELILSLASDGRDNTDFAGALCDNESKERAVKAGLDPNKYLEDNNSYEFFEKTGDMLITGETGSNVADLVIAIKS